MIDRTATGPQRAAGAARTAVVWEALRHLLADFAVDAEAPLEIVDAGGGTGGAAVPLAELGHQVTVVDPNPDSLAALERRAAEAGVRVRALQGETRDLPELLPPGQAHLVLMHNVLEHVEDPLGSLVDAAGLLRPSGAISVLAPNAVAGALHRAFAGHLADAHSMLTDPQGRWGEGDPMPRRFGAEQLAALAREAGFEAVDIRGVRVFTDLLPGRVLEEGAHSGAELLELEKAASEHPVLSGIATQLHLLAHRSGE